MRSRAAATASVLTALALALSACGSSATTTTVTAASAGSSTAATAITTPSSTTTTTGSTAPGTTTTAGGLGPCVAADLGLSFLGQQGATGHGLLGFAVRNTSPKSCRTFGYPGIQFLGKAGEALPTVPTHTTHDFFGTAPEVAIVLAPGQQASFRLGVTHGAVPGEPCTTADALQVIAPDDTATLRATIPDGAYECRGTTVSPLRPGTSAYP
jgi:hypothetical protein